MTKNYILLPAILVFHLFFLSHLQFTPWPEMLYRPYFLLSGLLPYKDFAMEHFPGLVLGLAFYYKLLGESLITLKIFTWGLILVTDILIFTISGKVTKDSKISVISTIFYLLTQIYFGGNGLWFDLALAPIMLGVFFLINQKKIFWSGLLFGFGILIKQTAFWFLIPVVLMVRLTNKDGSFGKFLIGISVPLILLVIYLAHNNILSDFYYWAINFGILYLPRANGQIQLPDFKQILVVVPGYIFFFVAIWEAGREKAIKSNKLVIILIAWIIFGSIGIYPRFELFHLQPALPFLAILSGMIIEGLLNSSRRIPNIFLVGIVGLVILLLNFKLIQRNYDKPDRFYEPQTLEVSDWLNTNIYNKQIYILNSWDHIYFLAGKVPAISPCIPTLSWFLEYPGVQDKLVSQLEKTKPVIVFEKYADMGLGSYIPKKIDKFIKDNYTQTNIIANRFIILRPHE